MNMNARVFLWEAINDYARACGGDTSDKTVGAERMNAVSKVERALDGPKLQPGARVYVLARLFGGLEEQYGVIVTGKTRDERPYGVGDVRPHVRVAFDGDSTPRWVCVDELRQR